MPNTLPLLLLVGGIAYVSSSTVHNARSAATLKVPAVTFHAKEFTFVGAQTIAAGQTTFRLVNDGQVVHHLTILRLARGKTMADVKQAMQTAASWPTWLTAVGGTNAAVPGDSLEATLTLEPGRYVVVCILASPGEQIPHTRKGMFVPLTVTAARGATKAGSDFAPTPCPTSTSSGRTTGSSSPSRSPPAITPSA